MRAAWLVLAVLAAPAPAQTIYKWVDDEGRTHYGQEQPAGKTARPVEVRPNLVPGLTDGERQRLKALEAKEAAARKAAATPPAATPAARAPQDAAVAAECGTNPAADCAMVAPPPGPPALRDDPFERLGAPGAIPAIPPVIPLLP